MLGLTLVSRDISCGLLLLGGMSARLWSGQAIDSNVHG